MKFDFILTNLKKYAVYIGFLAITLIASIILTVWSVKTPSTGTVEIIKTATAHINEGTIVEYLAGEQVDVEFVTLELEDGRVLTADEYTVEADLTTAGKKAVSLVYTENGVKHVGTYTVEVFLIRHFDIRSYPKVVSSSNGQLNFNGLIIWAELSGIPTSGRFSTTPEHPDWKNTVVIENGMYDLSVTEKEFPEKSVASISVGNRDASFTFIKLPTGMDMYKLGNAVDVLTFTNSDSQSNDKLWLFVDTQETNASDSPNGATGYYVYETNNGGSVSYTYYRFAYHMDGWTSYFKSSSFGEGLTDEAESSNYNTVNVTVNGKTFVSATTWRKVIVPIAG